MSSFLLLIKLLILWGGAFFIGYMSPTILMNKKDTNIK